MEFVRISQSPVTTTGYFDQVFIPQGWYHKLSASPGLYDKCSFSIFGTRTELENLFNEGLGRNVERYTQDGNKLIWQGFINEMVLTEPGFRSRISLDEMFDQMYVQYTALNTAVNPPTETANSLTSAANDTESQNRYGTKTKVFRPPYDKMTSTMADQLRDTLLAQYKQPRRSDNAISAEADLELKIFCNGYIHTLDWSIYNQIVSSGTDQARDQVYLIVDDAGQFISDIDVLPGNLLSVQQYYGDNETALTTLKMLASLGDSSDNRWIIYVDDGRVFRYKQASSTVEYVRKLSDKEQKIETADDRRNVPYWEIRPNRWIRTTDIYRFEIEPASLIDDKQCMYIETVEWYETGNRLVLTGSKGEQIQTIIAKNANLGEFLL